MRTIVMTLNTEAQRTQRLAFPFSMITVPLCFKNENHRIMYEAAKFLEVTTERENAHRYGQP